MEVIGRCLLQNGTMQRHQRIMVLGFNSQLMCHKCKYFNLIINLFKFSLKYFAEFILSLSYDQKKHHIKMYDVNFVIENIRRLFVHKLLYIN